MRIIHVAVVENEERTRMQVSCLLKMWEEHAVYSVLLETFTNGEDFLSGDYENIHLVFMDIELDGVINGVDTAKELRKRNKKIAIVFLTSYQEYALTGYKVNAMDYLVKPIQYANIEWCMNQLIDQLSEGCLTVKRGNEILRIRYNDIIYLQSHLHYIDIITTDKKYTYKSSMKDLKTQLTTQFVQCHRAVIVNMNHIQSLHTRELVMTDKYKLPISDTYLKAVREQYFKKNS